MMVTTVVVLLVLIGFLVRPRRSHRKALNLPPGPRGWPVFGSLSLLAGTLPPHRVLATLAARYGPLMHLRLGSFDVVVASSAEAARLVLKTHDLAFADRPPAAWGAIIAYNYKGIVHTPYGPYWRMARKLCATELFSARLVDAFEPVRAEETRDLFERAGAAVPVRELLMGFTMRSILRMALGEKWPGSYGSAAEGEVFRRSLEEAFEVSGAVSNVGEWMPWLAWLDVQGLTRRMRRVHAVVDRFSEQIARPSTRTRTIARAPAPAGSPRGTWWTCCCDKPRTGRTSQPRPGSLAPASRPSCRTSFPAARRPRR